MPEFAFTEISRLPYAERMAAIGILTRFWFDNLDLLGLEVI